MNAEYAELVELLGAHAVINKSGSAGAARLYRRATDALRCRPPPAIRHRSAAWRLLDDARLVNTFSRAGTYSQDCDEDAPASLCTLIFVSNTNAADVLAATSLIGALHENGSVVFGFKAVRQCVEDGGEGGGGGGGGGPCMIRLAVADATGKHTFIPLAEGATFVSRVVDRCAGCRGKIHDDQQDATVKADSEGDGPLLTFHQGCLLCFVCGGSVAAPVAAPGEEAGAVARPAVCGLAECGQGLALLQEQEADEAAFQGLRDVCSAAKASAPGEFDAAATAPGVEKAKRRAAKVIGADIKITNVCHAAENKMDKLAETRYVDQLSEKQELRRARQVYDERVAAAQLDGLGDEAIGLLDATTAEKRGVLNAARIGLASARAAFLRARDARAPDLVATYTAVRAAQQAAINCAEDAVPASSSDSEQGVNETARDGERAPRPAAPRYLCVELD